MDQLYLVKAFSRSDTYMVSTYYKDIVVMSFLPKEKAVYIHYNDGSKWKDTQMILTVIGDGFCTWEYHDVSGPMGGGFPPETELAIYADTGDERIWDNNGGSNYHLGMCDGPLLGRNTAIELYEASIYPIQNSKPPFAITGGIIIKNLGYQKKVIVNYKSNKSDDVCEAIFAEEYTVGEHDDLKSPNINNCEMFRFTANVFNSTQIKFFLTYEVNDQCFTDDNFGQGYILKFHQPEVEKPSQKMVEKIVEPALQ
jgi:hypothetical protein